MRACLMPFAAMRPMKSSYMQGGSKPNVLTRPAISRIGVSGQSAQMRLMRSHGSSRSSRTAFLMCEPERSSIATKPASFRFLAIGSIMPVDMRSAHRLWWPSRMVVSTKRISSMQPLPVASYPSHDPAATWRSRGVTRLDTPFRGRPPRRPLDASPPRGAEQKQGLAELDELAAVHQDLLDRAGDLGLHAGED